MLLLARVVDLRDIQENLQVAEVLEEAANVESIIYHILCQSTTWNVNPPLPQCGVILVINAGYLGA